MHRKKQSFLSNTSVGAKNSLPDGFYKIGDTNKDEFVDAYDAARILSAISNAPSNQIYIYSSTYKQHVGDYFPRNLDPNSGEIIDEIPYYKAPDAIQDSWLNSTDSTGILNYAAIIGAGNNYSGSIGCIAQEDD